MRSDGVRMKRREVITLVSVPVAAGPLTRTRGASEEGGGSAAANSGRQGYRRLFRFTLQRCERGGLPSPRLPSEAPPNVSHATYGIGIPI